MNAERLMLIGGVAAFLLTISWVRSRALREKYAVLWLLVALTLLICGVFPSLVMVFADRMKLAYPSAVLFISLAAIYVFCFSVSISLSRQYRHTTRLMQELAILELRLRRLEAQGASNPDAGEPNDREGAPRPDDAGPPPAGEAGVKAGR